MHCWSVKVFDPLEVYMASDRMLPRPKPRPDPIARPWRAVHSIKTNAVTLAVTLFFIFSVRFKEVPKCVVFQLLTCKQDVRGVGPFGTMRTTGLQSVQVE